MVIFDCRIEERRAKVTELGAHGMCGERGERASPPKRKPCPTFRWARKRISARLSLDVLRYLYFMFIKDTYNAAHTCAAHFKMYLSAHIHAI